MRMDADAKAQLLKLHDDMLAPDQSLANILRRAIVVASMLGKHDYRFVFEAHLSGPADAQQPKFKGYPDGYRPEIDAGMAIIRDRSTTDKKVFGASVEVIETIAEQTKATLTGLGPSEMAEIHRHEPRIHDGAQCLGRIRNRVTFFVASALSSMSTVQRETDHLTGLLTLPEFTRDLVRLLQMHQGRVCIALADLDDFKSLNTRLGLDNADKVIVKFSELLSDTILQRGIVYRRSGGEFYVILENYTAAEAAALMGRVCERVAEYDLEQGLTPGSVTISVGVAEGGVHANDAKELREVAELANKAAKDAGKNRVFVPPITGPNPAP